MWIFHYRIIVFGFSYRNRKHNNSTEFRILPLLSCYNWWRFSQTFYLSKNDDNNNYHEDETKGNIRSVFFVQLANVVSIRQAFCSGVDSRHVDRTSLLNSTISRIAANIFETSIQSDCNWPTFRPFDNSYLRDGRFAEFAQAVRRNRSTYFNR